MNKTNPVYEFIEDAKQLGFAVYAPKEITSYFYFSKNDKIGYAQINRITEISFSTVHKANITSGTGFAAGSFSEALEFCPYYFREYYNSVIKYKSLDDFLNNHWQKLVQY